MSADMVLVEQMVSYDAGNETFRVARKRAPQYATRLIPKAVFDRYDAAETEYFAALDALTTLFHAERSEAPQDVDVRRTGRVS